MIRLARSKKGIGLNAFAKELGVSPGYLSNLETGKTETIQLSLLEKIQDELGILPIQQGMQSTDELDLRIQRIMNLLKEVENVQPELVDYLLSTVERGIDVYKQQDS